METLYNFENRDGFIYRRLVSNDAEVRVYMMIYRARQAWESGTSPELPRLSEQPCKGIY